MLIENSAPALCKGAILYIRYVELVKYEKRFQFLKQLCHPVLHTLHCLLRCIIIFQDTFLNLVCKYLLCLLILWDKGCLISVSYTHLMLPTTPYV